MNNQLRINQLIDTICERNKDFGKDMLKYHKDIRAILNSSKTNNQKTRELFPRLMHLFSYQGISDERADRYIEDHGDITFMQITRSLNKYKKENGKLCSKLQNFDSFVDCGYKKTSETCNNPYMFSRCPVPCHDLRTGILNQKAYSFYFFLRDKCQGDIISYVDNIINSHMGESVSDDPGTDAVIGACDEIIGNFVEIYGVANKLANMALAEPFMLYRENPRWKLVGQSMIAIDSLVHNFLHRTGILEAYDAEHKYRGDDCATKCTSVLQALSKEIDASKFDKSYPKYFPRFVQVSIWSYCHKICNGNRIDDKQPCALGDECVVSNLCAKVPLKG